MIADEEETKKDVEMQTPPPQQEEQEAPAAAAHAHNRAEVHSENESVSLAEEDGEDVAIPYGWRKANSTPSLPETYATVSVAAENAAWWRKLRSFTGLGFIVSVGYMDPGKF